ncbi:DUF6520 family protein [Christiangramia flava]|uniref:Uncharacterized protein n=1 Tax=Christiangramia flava JLT2011 TaxID=1229726 RepID=A0A1L7I9G6_9FLAO|nr:DUF6520 family protein [Christiangramia flava]APU69843.1 hypothetical protein GRFL_3119 [Christiangramia flava JLT2011]OSS37841.1 hypothetical protein C723_3310 [Christiangramia flava JLT2011]
MKIFKSLMPVMALVMAVGLAFANKADVQSNGWVERNNMPYQLQTDPCNSGTQELCKVSFTDDLGTIHQVYTTSDLQTPKKDGSGVYILSE